MPTFPDPDDRLVLDPACERCPALADCRERIAWGNGPADADVFVVGEAPGAGDPDADRWRGGNWTGMAYTSRHSGRRIRDLLSAAGYGPDRCFFTNAVKCFPADPDDPATNREPTAAELSACRDHLRAELDAVAPAVVVPTGKHATASVFALDGRDLGGFLDCVLDPVESDAADAWVLPLLHPSYQAVWLSRLGDDREAYVADLAAELDRLVGT